MKIARMGACVFLFCGAGCAQVHWGGYETYELGPARDVIVSAVEAHGGLRAWRKAGPIETWALVSAYDEQGQPWVTRQRQVIDLKGGRITARVDMPERDWTATVRRSGASAIDTHGLKTDAFFERRLSGALWWILHHAYGPLNLLGMGEHPLNVRPAKIEGHEVVRVGALDEQGWPWTYYFDRSTNLLRYLTCGGDEPGDSGTFASFEYAMTSRGLAFMKRLRVVEIGPHTRSGGRPVLEAEFSDVTVGDRPLVF